MKTLFLSVICFLCLFSLSAQKRDYHIGVLYDQETPESDELFSRLTSEITAVIGEDAVVHFSEENYLSSLFDLDRAKQNYNKLLARNVDFIISFGTTNDLYLSTLKEYSTPTLIVGSVLNKSISVTEESPSTGVHNLAYLVVRSSFAEDITMLRKMATCNTIGIVINEDLFTPSVKQAYDDLAEQEGFSYSTISFKTFLSDYTFDYDIDGIYFASGYYMPRHVIKSLSDTLISHFIPSLINGGVRNVKDGIMATLHGDENTRHFLRHIALMTESVVNGTNPSQIEGFVSFDSNLAMNFGTMSNINVQPKYDILYNVDFVDDVLKIKSDKSYTLPLLMREAVQHNLGLLSAGKDVELSTQEVRNAKSSYLPEVTASTTIAVYDPDKAIQGFGQSPEYTGSANVTLNQLIYSHESSRNTSIQEILEKAQKEYYNTEELNTVYNAVTAYFSSLMLKTNLQIVRLNLQLTEKNLNIAKQNFVSGQSGKADILRFESNKAEDTKDLVDYFSQLRQSYYDINVLLNNPVYARIDVDEADLSSDAKFGSMFDKISEIVRVDGDQQSFVDFLSEKAIENAPEIKALLYNIEAVDRSIELYGAQRYIPTVALSAGYDYTYFRAGEGKDIVTGYPEYIEGYYSGGVTLSVPLISRNQKRIDKAKSTIQRDQLDFSKSETILSIQKSIACVLIDIGKQLSFIQLSVISEESAKSSYELTLDSYMNGAVPIVQLLDAQRYYIQAKLSVTNAKYNFLLAMFTLERYVGRFTFLNTPEENEKFLEEYNAFVLSSKNK